MRKVIAFVVLGALVSTLLTSPAQALNYDPKNPGPAERVSHAVSGDDGGWGDVEYTSEWDYLSLNAGLISPNLVVMGMPLHGLFLYIVGELSNHDVENDVGNRAN